jgi:flagellin-like hook-associated protein FlgL
LKDELTRISNATEYNGMNVLNGTYQSDDGRGQWRIQIGAENDVNNQHQFSVMDSTATGLGLQPDMKATDRPSLATVINNDEVEVHIDKTTGSFTESGNSNAVKLESDGSSLYVVGMKSTTLSSAIDASNNGGGIVVTDPTGFDSGGGTVAIDGDEISYGGITTTTTSSLEITSAIVAGINSATQCRRFHPNHIQATTIRFQLHGVAIARFSEATCCFINMYLDLIIIDNSCKARTISSLHVWLQPQSRSSGIHYTELMLVVDIVFSPNLNPPLTSTIVGLIGAIKHVHAIVFSGIGDSGQFILQSLKL